MLFIVSQMCFNKNHLPYFFMSSLFFELLDNLATHITWLSEEDPVELCQPHFVELSNTVWAQKKLTK